jgi:hypothetical protein
MERFNLKKLSKIEGKEQYYVVISNRFASLENLDTEVDVNKAWETTGNNETVQQPFVNFKKAYDSVRREVLYNIVIRVWGTREAS